MHTVLETGQLFQSDRPARMHAARRDADFRAHAELSTIGKLGRGIVHNDGAVHFLEELVGRALILGDDALGVVRAVVGDVIDGTVDTIHQSGGDDRIEIFGRPVFLVGQFGSRQQGLDFFRAPDQAARLAQRLQKPICQRGRVGDSPVDQQRLCGAANAGAAHLGVDGDGFSLRGIGVLVDIDMANAFQMGEDRHTGFGLDTADKAFAATGAR